MLTVRLSKTPDAVARPVVAVRLVAVRRERMVLRALEGRQPVDLLEVRAQEQRPAPVLALAAAVRR